MSRILFEGNNVEAFPYCTESHLAQSFRQLGHTVDYVIVQHSTPENLTSWLNEEPDLVLLVRPWGTTSGATPEFFAACDDRGIPVVGFHLDRFWGLPEREQWIHERSDPLFCVDVLFSTDDTPEWEAAGIRHHWLPPGVFGPECYDAAPEPDLWPYDVAFVGSAPDINGGNYHPEWGHRAELVARLRDWYGARFVHVGNGGDRPGLRGHDLNVCYASVPVIVGDSCFVQADRPYWSDRVPETWGRGGFLVHPRVKALVAHLGGYPGAWWEPGGWDALQAEIEEALDEPEFRDAERRRIAAIVTAEDTYARRAATILEVMGV